MNLINGNSSSRNREPVEREEPEARRPTKIYVSDYTGCACEIMATDELPQEWKLSACPKGWRLPTRREITCMCSKSKQIGGFETGRMSYYWTEEEVGKGDAYAMSFDDCEWSKKSTSKELRVRCVRD
jgi:hypothetical protein